jgi:ribosome-associated translation inhibitor RaiA
MVLPLTVHTTLQRSSPLLSHIEMRLARAVRPFAAEVDRAEVWLADTNGRKQGPSDKLVRVVLRLSRGGRVVVTAASDDFYAGVARAAARARAMLARRIQTGRERHVNRRIPQTSP